MLAVLRFYMPDIHLFLQSQPVVKGFADDGADEAVGLGTAVVHDGLELVIVDEAVGEDRFIGLLGYDFSDEDSRFVVIALAFAFKGYGKFFDDRGLDVAAFMDVAAGHFDLIDAVPRFDAKIIGQDHRILGRKGNGKGAGLFDVVRRLVFIQKECDFIEIGLGTPGCVHGIGNAIFIVGSDNEHPFRGDASFFSGKFFTHDVIPPYGYFLYYSRNS